jgi:hypothetical protein
MRSTIQGFDPRSPPPSVETPLRVRGLALALKQPLSTQTRRTSAMKRK